MIKCGLTGSTGVLGQEFLKIYKNKFKFSKFSGDITNKKHVNNWVSKNNFNLVIHLAAIVPTNIVKKNFKKAKKVNVTGTSYLADAILSKNKNIWLFFSSTSHVYKISNSKKKLKENSKLIPYSKYGKTKLNAEKLLISKFKNKKKLHNLSIGRIFSFTSFNQKKTFLIPNLVEKISNLPNPEFKNLNHFRDFVSKKDICKAIYLLFKSRSSGIINICSGRPIKLKFIAKLISLKLKKKITVKMSYETSYLIGDNSKLKLLGWKVTENINKIIINYLNKK